MEKLLFETSDGEEIELIIEAQVRMGGRNFILVSEDDGEEEADAMILEDVSGPEEEDSVYVPVEDRDVLDALIPLFEEELGDADILE